MKDKSQVIPDSKIIDVLGDDISSKGTGSAAPGSEKTTPNKKNQTRSAIDVTKTYYDKDGEAVSEQSYRVKMVLYGNQRCCEEIYMEKLYSLIPGTNSPHTLFGTNFHMKIPFKAAMPQKKDHQYNKENGIPDYFVASPYTKKTFQDLGEFLMDLARYAIPEKFRTSQKEGALPLKPGEVHEDSYYANLQIQVEEINGTKGADKDKKRGLLFKIYKLLPKKIRSKFDIMYYNSKWTGNWDLLNLSMFNSGFVYDPKAKNPDNMFIPTLVDFGNCGPTGFGGLYKEESLFRSNAPAKPRKKPGEEDKDSASDYDPELPALITKEDVTLKRKHPSSIVSIGELPRNLPFAQLLEKQIKGQFNNHDTNIKMPDEALESAYSLLLVSDESISRSMDEWHLVGEGKPLPFLELSKEDLSKIYPPTAIKEALNFLAKNDGSLSEEELQEKYSHDAFKELKNNLEKIIKEKEIKVDDYFSKGEVSENIVEGLFEIAKDQRKILDQQYSCEGMKQVMQSRRDDFAAQFPAKDILGWERRNPQRAEFLREDAIKKASIYTKDMDLDPDEKEEDEAREHIDIRRETFKLLNQLHQKINPSTYKSGSRDI